MPCATRFANAQRWQTHAHACSPLQNPKILQTVTWRLLSRHIFLTRKTALPRCDFLVVLIAPWFITYTWYRSKSIRKYTLQSTRLFFALCILFWHASGVVVGRCCVSILILRSVSLFNCHQEQHRHHRVQSKLEMRTRSSLLLCFSCSVLHLNGIFHYRPYCTWSWPKIQRIQRTVAGARW